MPGLQPLLMLNECPFRTSRLPMTAPGLQEGWRVRGRGQRRVHVRGGPEGDRTGGSRGPLPQQKNALGRQAAGRGRTQGEGVGEAFLRGEKREAELNAHKGSGGVRVNCRNQAQNVTRTKRERTAALAG